MRTLQRRGGALVPRRRPAFDHGITEPGQLRRNWRSEGQARPGAWEVARVWLFLCSACALFWVLLLAWIERLLS